MYTRTRHSPNVHSPHVSSKRSHAQAAVAARLGPAADMHTGSRRQQRACYETRAPDRDGPDRTGRFTGSLKNRPVQPIFSGLIAWTVFEVNRAGIVSGSVFYRSDRRSGPVQITRVKRDLKRSTQNCKSNRQVIWSWITWAELTFSLGNMGRTGASGPIVLGPFERVSTRSLRLKAKLRT